jgi:hypothetical protein
VSIVFYVLFDTSLGLVNLAIGKIGIQAIPWITSPIFSKLSIVFMVTWKWVGYNMIIALAGLQSIDTQVYDAAKIDGAGTCVPSFGSLSRCSGRDLLHAHHVYHWNLQHVHGPYILTQEGRVIPRLPSCSTCTGFRSSSST